MTDAIVFFALCGMATLMVYFYHAVRELRNEMGIRQRVTALEEKVFGTEKIEEPVLPKPAERRARTRKMKEVKE